MKIVKPTAKTKQYCLNDSRVAEYHKKKKMLKKMNVSDMRLMVKQAMMGLMKVTSEQYDEVYGNVKSILVEKYKNDKKYTHV